MGIHVANDAVAVDIDGSAVGDDVIHLKVCSVLIGELGHKYQVANLVGVFHGACLDRQPALAEEGGNTVTASLGGKHHNGEQQRKYNESPDQHVTNYTGDFFKFFHT